MSNIFIKLKNSFWCLPDKLKISIFFLVKQGYLMNWSKPVTFNQKIQARKLGLSNRHAILADKIKVRDYVRKKCGDEILIPILAKYKNTSEIDTKSLPDSWVMKTNHGSGPEHIEIVWDKDRVSQHKIVEKFNHALQEDYVGVRLGETHYNLIDRHILVEELMLSEGKIPDDYKFHVFQSNGDFKWFLQVDFDRYSKHKRNLYDDELNLLDYSLNYQSGNFEIENKELVFEMAEVAKKLATDFNYVRVDLYLIDSQIYFGELTFLPASGFQKFHPREVDKEWGKLWAKSTDGMF
ncbi:ATP-grasp fold amidoligase family protein [Vibrio breoganii]